jgi:hypothetical protein
LTSYLSIALKRHIQARHLIVPAAPVSCQPEASTADTMPRLESTNRIPSPVISPAPRLWIKPMSELKASLAAVAATQIHAFPDEEKDVDMMDMSCNSSSPLDEGQAHVLENGTSGPPLDNGSSFKARLRIGICIFIRFHSSFGIRISV